MKMLTSVFVTAVALLVTLTVASQAAPVSTIIGAP